jgi:type I restriction enzyme S subunit
MESFVTLGDYVSTQKGFAFKSKWFVDSGREIVKVSDFTEDSICPTNLVKISNDLGEQYSRYSLSTGDVVIQTVGSWPSNPASVVGKTIRVPKSVDEALLNQNAVKIIPSEELHGGFLYYLLRSEAFKEFIIGTAQGAASQASITLDAIKRYKFLLPQFEVQADIAEYLENYDNLIENNNRRIAILEDMAQSLYREWFVNFRYPNHEDNLDADGKPKLIDSPLGQIPEGWDVKRLDDYVTLQRGFDLPKAKRNKEGGIPIYAASGLTGYHDEIKAKGPGIVTGRSGTLGIVKLVLEDHWPLNTSLWVKKFENCTAHYAYYLLDSIGLERFNSGASVPTLNRNDVHGNPVIAPPQEVVNKFEEIVEVKHKQINVLKRKNTNLKQQRDMLLPKLISGQIEL